MSLLDPDAEMTDILVEAEAVIDHYADKKSWRQYAARAVLYVGDVMDGHFVASQYFYNRPRLQRGSWDQDAVDSRRL